MDTTCSQLAWVWGMLKRASAPDTDCRSQSDGNICCTNWANWSGQPGV